MKKVILSACLLIMLLVVAVVPASADGTTAYFHIQVKGKWLANGYITVLPNATVKVWNQYGQLKAVGTTGYDGYVHLSAAVGWNEAFYFTVEKTGFPYTAQSGLIGAVPKPRDGGPIQNNVRGLAYFYWDENYLPSGTWAAWTTGWYAV